MSLNESEFANLLDKTIDNNRTIVSVKNDIAELKADVAVLKADVAELKADVAVLKADVAELKADMAEVKGDVALLKHLFFDHDKKINKLLASDDEQRHNISLILESVSYLVEEQKKMKLLTSHLEIVKDEHPQLKQVVKEHINDKTVHLNP